MSQFPFDFADTLLCDPLDGSSNIDCGVSIGTVRINFTLLIPNLIAVLENFKLEIKLIAS